MGIRDDDADGPVPCSVLQLCRLFMVKDAGAMPSKGRELNFLRKSVVGLPT